MPWKQYENDKRTFIDALSGPMQFKPKFELRMDHRGHGDQNASDS
jgi:hypothetical protein